ncbi:hypothetical protein [Pseudooctadecabacter jejudonensis]|uniref:Tetratricopeptide repeat protein n=1 Tax=Pseudooctadecabacter jejudonensis TaxID=1391910 RepID=A0A1Y5TBC7_9RHOB|nr:hypothetical protein [Pseudooctadecabacter jejudonensis]SLN60133.1 hypothetical protein PSJ8397_03204 [Pseudooctadecabacter jejudonensis]
MTDAAKDQHDDLNAALLAAHDAGDATTLVGLYTRAADIAADTDTACFFLTQAYIFALEVGDTRAGALKRRLSAEGRL